MLREQIIMPHVASVDATTGEVDIATVATVQVTSEVTSDTLEHPIDHTFDEHRGSEGTRRVAGELGEQAVIRAYATNHQPDHSGS